MTFINCRHQDLDNVSSAPYLAENGVLSWELALSVLSRPPGVEVLRGTPDPNPMGLGLSVLEPDLMLDVLH